MSGLRQKHVDAYRDSRRFARGCALQVLYQLDMGDWEDHDRVFDNFWQQLESDDELSAAHEPAAVKSFVKRLVDGVVQTHDNVDEKLAEYAQHWSLARMTLIDRNILRLAAYEMMYCDDIPAKASVNEAIELAKQFGDKDSPKFVNGILDNFLRILNEQT